MYKKDFPYFTNSNSVYLDSGATTQKPQSVIVQQLNTTQNTVQTLIEVVLEMPLMPQLSLKIQEKF